ncbi:hypothetical protein [Sphingomonas sp.]|uniref:hypothetical protein n=1 Tax=Sphingomonas sp. TaxID=28214 RepID=UPI003F72C851
MGMGVVEAFMAYIDELFENGGNYIIERTQSGASLQPASTRQADLESFQALVCRLRMRDGEGFSIIDERPVAGRGDGSVELVTLRLVDPPAH